MQVDSKPNQTDPHKCCVSLIARNKSNTCVREASVFPDATIIMYNYNDKFGCQLHWVQRFKRANNDLASAIRWATSVISKKDYQSCVYSLRSSVRSCG